MARVRVTSALALGLLALLAAPFGAAAKFSGGGWHSHGHSHSWWAHVHRHRFPFLGDGFLFGGGYYPFDDYPTGALGDPSYGYAIPVAAAAAPALPVSTCHHSQAVITVPSEAGGTKDITITRC